MEDKAKTQVVMSWLAASLLAFLFGIFALTPPQVSQAVTRTNDEWVATGDGLDSTLFPPRFGQLSAVAFQKALSYEMGGVALDTSGSVWSWGYNFEGRTGVQAYQDGTPLSTSTDINGYLGGMKKIEYFEDNQIEICELSSGHRFVLALDSAGNVYGWGRDIRGEMGQGSLTGTNSTPRKIPKLPEISQIFSSCNDEGGTSNFALARDGNLWAWGANTAGKLGINNKSHDALSPVQVPRPRKMTGKIVGVASGDLQTHILTDTGEVWYVGSSSGGRLGNGRTSSANTLTLTKLTTPTGMGKIIDLSTGQWHTLALDDQGIVWEWGLLAANTMFTSYDSVAKPRKVALDLTDALASFNKGYTPIPQRVFAGWRNGYFVDQYGRPWSWGHGGDYGFGLDTSLGNVNFFFRKQAVQLPNLIGDGVTGPTKYPRYLSDPTKPTGKLPNALGMYGSLGSRTYPTIYDHKYLLRNQAGHFLDEQGNEYRYNDRSTEGRIAGFFYRLDASGQWTAQTGVPTVAPAEKAWIALAGQAVPSIAFISLMKDAFTLTDRDGNIYKWGGGGSGSGSLAWGWDVDPQFDAYPSNQHQRVGLYDRYNYEMMVMRGGPRLPAPELSLTSDLEKIYVPQGKEAKKTELRVSVKLPAQVDVTASGLAVETKLHAAQAIIMPYDTDDPLVSLRAPTEAEVASALANPAYQVLDLIAQVGWPTPVQNPSQQEALDLSTTVSLQANSVVWLVTSHTSADSAQPSQRVVRKVVDNYYQEMQLSHQGVEESQRTHTLYADAFENVVKVTADGISQTVGFPVDVKGKIIGTPAQPPTHGYDEVKVERLSDTQLGEQLAAYWRWYDGQTRSKTYRLNGVDNPQNADVTQARGELKVSTHYTHTFLYEKNPKGYGKLHYLAVDAQGNKLGDFQMTMEEVKKGQELERTPQALSSQQLIAKSYRLMAGHPPSTFPLSLTGMNALNEEGKLKVTLPFSEEASTYTLVILYDSAFAQVHVRQVIVAETAKVSLPRQAYLTLVPWGKDGQAANVFATTQLTSDQPIYSDYQVKLHAGNMGYDVKYLLPQYYAYLGHKQDAQTGAYDEQQVVSDPVISLDFSENREYWLTIYLTPQTAHPFNYTWGTALNSFGVIRLTE